MIRSFVLFFIVIILNACVPKPATEQQKKDKINSANFDKSVIKNIKKYETLKIFLENNLDAIIKFRHSKNTTTMINGQGKSDSTYLADDNCYTFFQGNSRNDIMNVPDNLKKKLDSLFHSFNEREIKSFTVCKDNKISIEVRSEESDENGLYISHSIHWYYNTEKNDAHYINKDTLIKSNCIYRIEIIEHHGH